MQDQVLEQVVNLSESVFLHRQLYVAWSPLGRPDDIGFILGLQSRSNPQYMSRNMKHVKTLVI